MTQVKRIMISVPNSLLVEIDVIAASESLDRSEFVREALQLYVNELKRRSLREQMKSGYVEMAQINLALAIELYKLEEEVTPRFEAYVAEAK